MNSKSTAKDRCDALPDAPSGASTNGDGAAVVAGSATTGHVARLSSKALLDGANEVEIEHNGALYRLRQTSLGKLILTK